MTNPIVTVNVTLNLPPTPSVLQKTGAVISQGGTILSSEAYALLTQPSDLTPLLPAPLNLTSLSWGAAYGGQVTATTSSPHGITINEQFPVQIAGAVPAGYNGSFVATATGSSTFTYFLTANPGSETTPGTYTQKNVGELIQMVNTFFAQGLQQSVYVLELGAGEPTAGVATLTDFINNSPQFFYSYLVPRAWDGNTAFLALIALFENTTAKTYFFVTTTLQNYGLYTSVMKDVIAMIETPDYEIWPQNALTAATWSGGLVTATTTTNHGVAPGDYFTIQGHTPAGYNGTFIALPGTTASTLVYAVASNPGSTSVDGTLVASKYDSDLPQTEFSHASDYYRSLNYAPSTTNKVAPFGYGFLFGVTQFPLRGNNALLTTLKAANVNVVGNGGEGGLSNAVLFYGRTMDGKPFNYWYSVDWMQINIDLALSNTITEGSNTDVNPLYINQDGINRLQQSAQEVGIEAISFGLAIGQVIQTSLDQPTFLANLNAGKYAGQLVINAIPFTTYYAANPSDYPAGIYNGLTMVYTPARGFDHIIFNIVATDLVAGP